MVTRLLIFAFLFFMGTLSYADELWFAARPLCLPEADSFSIEPFEIYNVNLPSFSKEDVRKFEDKRGLLFGTTDNGFSRDATCHLGGKARGRGDYMDVSVVAHLSVDYPEYKTVDPECGSNHIATLSLSVNEQVVLQKVPFGNWCPGGHISQLEYSPGYTSLGTLRICYQKPGGRPVYRNILEAPFSPKVVCHEYQLTKNSPPLTNKDMQKLFAMPSKK